MVDWAEQGTFEDVLASARTGDDRAFAVLWRWLHPPLLRWLTVVEPRHAEDVASEVWLSVARGLSSFEGDEHDFRAWVFTTARRRAIDLARRRRRQPALAGLAEADVADPTAVSSALVDAALALEAALKLLHRLTADQREVVALRVIVGMSVAETAIVVNKTEGAVRALCHRGLRTLAELLHTQPLDVGVPA